MLHRGVVSKETSVEKITRLVAKAASPLYLEARMLVVAPAGIAASNTQTPVTIGSR